MRKAGWISSIVLMVVSALSGLYETATSTSDLPTSALQWVVWFAVALYGVVGVVGSVGLVRRRPWSVAVSATWAIAIVCAATIASFAFHDPTFSQPGTLVGVVGSGLSTTTIGALVVWAARVATRAPAAPKVP